MYYYFEIYSIIKLKFKYINNKIFLSIKIEYVRLNPYPTGLVGTLYQLI